MREKVYDMILNGISYNIYFTRLITGYCYYHLEIEKQEKYMLIVIIDNKILNFKNNTKKLQMYCKDWVESNISNLEYYFNKMK